MPRSTATFATLTPIAPRPITASFFPKTSCPTNLFFSFSVRAAISGSSALAFVQPIPPTTSRILAIAAKTKSSLTPFAFAPGVLNTTIPWSAHLSSGMLLTPAPALATASSSGSNSISCIFALLTKMISAASVSSTLVY